MGPQHVKRGSSGSVKSAAEEKSAKIIGKPGKASHSLDFESDCAEQSGSPSARLDAPPGLPLVDGTEGTDAQDDVVDHTGAASSGAVPTQRPDGPKRKTRRGKGGQKEQQDKQPYQGSIPDTHNSWD